MYSILLIGNKAFFPRSILDESIEDPCLVLEHTSLTDLFPSILSEDPLVALIDGNALSENELGILTVLRRTFPHLRIILICPQSRRDLAAKAISSGADAYLLEPYFMDEATHFVRHSFEGALREVKQTIEMRMDALGMFIQGLAPELNNRLTPVLGALQLLMGRDSTALDEEEKQENYACIYRESVRIAKTMEEIENFAKPRKPKKNLVSLKKTVDQAISEANKESKNEVPIENDFNANLDRVLIDQRKIVGALKGVILFLKENAAEEKGRIEVSTYTPDFAQLHFTVQGFETVSIGEESINAFIPLYLRRSVRFGHELGLASSYGLIRSHGGTIKIKTTRNGTKFHIQVPLEEMEGKGNKAGRATHS